MCCVCCLHRKSRIFFAHALFFNNKVEIYLLRVIFTFYNAQLGVSLSLCVYVSIPSFSGLVWYDALVLNAWASNNSFTK